MFIKSTQAQNFKIGTSVTGRLYPSSPKGDQSIAMIDIDGKYPETGFSMNEVCTETLYLLEGALNLEYGEDHYEMHPGDVAMLLPQKKYRVRGKGKVAIFISPSWDSTQNKIISE